MWSDSSSTMQHNPFFWNVQSDLLLFEHILPVRWLYPGIFCSGWHFHLCLVAACVPWYFINSLCLPCVHTAATTRDLIYYTQLLQQCIHPGYVCGVTVHPLSSAIPFFGMSSMICFSSKYHQLIRTDFGSNLSEHTGSSHNSRYSRSGIHHSCCVWWSLFREGSLPSTSIVTSSYKKYDPHSISGFEVGAFSWNIN